MTNNGSQSAWTAMMSAIRSAPKNQWSLPSTTPRVPSSTHTPNSGVLVIGGPKYRDPRLFYLPKMKNFLAARPPGSSILRTLEEALSFDCVFNLLCTTNSVVEEKCCAQHWQKRNAYPYKNTKFLLLTFVILHKLPPCLFKH